VAVGITVNILQTINWSVGRTIALTIAVWRNSLQCQQRNRDQALVLFVTPYLDI